jgi:hypothetical protein
VLTAEGSTLKTDMCKLVFSNYGLKKNQSWSYLNHLVHKRQTHLLVRWNVTWGLWLKGLIAGWEGNSLFVSLKGHGAKMNWLTVNHFDFHFDLS